MTGIAPVSSVGIAGHRTAGSDSFSYDADSTSLPARPFPFPDRESFMQATETKLDAQELLQLALAESREGRHDRAISLLKQGRQAAPEDARILYLLGAEHAQIGLHDRAIEEIRQSVALDASIPSAHFQLGLLLLMRGENQSAEQAWVPLGQLSAVDPLRIFAEGLNRMVDGDAVGSIEKIEQGLARSKADVALSTSMQRILESIRAAGAKQDLADTLAALPDDSQHVLLSAYREG